MKETKFRVNSSIDPLPASTYEASTESTEILTPHAGWPALPSRRVMAWYAALCVAVMLTLGYPSLFFAEGILLLPFMGLALVSWHVQGRDSSGPLFTPTRLGDMGTWQPGTAWMAWTAARWNERLSRAIALVLWAVIASVTLAYSFSMAGPGPGGVKVSPSRTGAGAGVGVATLDIPDPLVSSVAATCILLGIAALSLFLLTPAGRKGAAWLLPVDPRVFRHGVGLSLMTLLALSWITPLLVRGGVPPVDGTLYLLSDSPEGMGAQAAGMVYELLLFVPLAFVAAGWPEFRNLRQASTRLGLRGATFKKATVGLIVGLILAGAAAFMLEPVVRWVWSLAGWPRSDTTLTDQLFAWAMNPWGALVVSLTAGAGEELLVRGLLQPRFGIILSNLAFAALHAYGYGWDGLLSVSVLGLALGVLRSRTDTPTTMLAHGMYNFSTFAVISMQH